MKEVTIEDTIQYMKAYLDEDNEYSEWSECKAYHKKAIEALERIKSIESEENVCKEEKIILDEITTDEAIYCMASYLPEKSPYTIGSHCVACKYYGSIPHRSGQGYICRSNEMHIKAIQALETLSGLNEAKEDLEKTLSKEIYNIPTWVDGVRYALSTIDYFIKKNSYSKRCNIYNAEDNEIFGDSSK